MSRRRKRQPEPSGGGMEWLLTFSDVLTLLITFFVLLISMSSMDSKKLRLTFGFFSGALGNLEAGKGVTHTETVQIEKSAGQSVKNSVDTEDKNIALGLAGKLKRQLSVIARKSRNIADRFRAQMREVASYKGHSPLDDHIYDLFSGDRAANLVRGPNSLRLGLHVGLFFVYRKVELRASAKQLLAQLRKTVAESELMRVEVPVLERGSSSQQAEPWDLAGWRASKLVRLLRPRSSAGARVVAGSQVGRRLLFVFRAKEG